MNVYTIVLERIGTGEPLLSIVTRQDNEAAARAYAEAAMAQSPDLRVVDIHARPCDSTDPPGGAAAGGLAEASKTARAGTKPDGLTTAVTNVTDQRTAGAAEATVVRWIAHGCGLTMLPGGTPASRCSRRYSAASASRSGPVGPQATLR